MKAVTALSLPAAWFISAVAMRIVFLHFTVHKSRLLKIGF
jgi:hypothetical protein